MKRFLIENVDQHITVDAGKYQQMLTQYIQNFADQANDYAYQLGQFKFDLEDFRHKLRQFGFPESEELLRDVRSQKIKDWETRYAWEKKLSDFYFQQRNGNWDLLQDIKKQFRMYGDQLGGSKEGFSDEQVKETYEEVMRKTNALLSQTIQLIKGAISRVEGWSSHATVEISTPYKIDDHDYDWLEGQGDSVHIKVKSPGNSAEYDPDFTLFTQDGKVEDIGDIIDSDDYDFFRSPEATSDYFNLIAELRQPGSTTRGKPMKLYTARPRRDRATYMGAKQSKMVPSGLWATTSYSRAVGLALPGELGASDADTRDVFEIGVNSKYLILHYDGGNFTDYQLTSKTGKVPIISIRHVH